MFLLIPNLMSLRPKHMPCRKYIDEFKSLEYGRRNCWWIFNKDKKRLKKFAAYDAYLACNNLVEQIPRLSVDKVRIL